ncbi:nickel-type superoxide dismutase maturation protease [Egicoccus sp. AB-alg6-2]|uniref:nickel-type superoxide dismutase maturation protease n=1 Tax=Egicoccus sp. AB-alg6-2 TaxID=3242692 RepID=UPI00359E7814
MAAKRPTTPQLRLFRNRPTAAATIVATATYLAVLAANRSVLVVRGPSMLPALWPGDRVVTLPALAPVRPGHVVVVRDPDERGHLVVKRVHAVEAGGVDVRGDHPRASTDSRTWGPLPRSAVRRRVVRRWPDLRTRL